MSKNKTIKFLKETEQFLKLCLELADITKNIKLSGEHPLDIRNGNVFEVKSKVYK